MTEHDIAFPLLDRRFALVGILMCIRRAATAFYSSRFTILCLLHTAFVLGWTQLIDRRTMHARAPRPAKRRADGTGETRVTRSAMWRLQMCLGRERSRCS